MSMILVIVVLCATSSSALLAQRPPEEALKAKLRQDIISSLSEVQRPVAQPPALSTLDRRHKIYPSSYFFIKYCDLYYGRCSSIYCSMGPL